MRFRDVDVFFSLPRLPRRIVAFPRWLLLLKLTHVFEMLSSGRA